jgi:cytochrome c oxidase cbb3-type subunit 4
MIPIINGIVTLALIILFIGIWIWAWSSRNKASFEEMSRLPLQEDNKLEGGDDVK